MIHETWLWNLSVVLLLAFVELAPLLSGRRGQNIEVKILWARPDHVGVVRYRFKIRPESLWNIISPYLTFTHRRPSQPTRPLLSRSLARTCFMLKTIIVVWLVPQGG